MPYQGWWSYQNTNNNNNNNNNNNTKIRVIHVFKKKKKKKEKNYTLHCSKIFSAFERSLVAGSDPSGRKVLHITKIFCKSVRLLVSKLFF